MLGLLMLTSEMELWQLESYISPPWATSFSLMLFKRQFYLSNSWSSWLFWLATLTSISFNISARFPSSCLVHFSSRISLFIISFSWLYCLHNSSPFLVNLAFSLMMPVKFFCCLEINPSVCYFSWKSSYSLVFNSCNFCSSLCFSHNSFSFVFCTYSCLFFNVSRFTFNPSLL